jgi:hypothetical protein
MGDFIADDTLDRAQRRRAQRKTRELPVERIEAHERDDDIVARGKPVAKLQLSRNDFSQPQPGAKQLAALKAAAPILTQEQLVKPDTNLNQIIDALIDAKPAQPIVAADAGK